VITYKNCQGSVWQIPRIEINLYGNIKMLRNLIIDMAPFHGEYS